MKKRILLFSTAYFPFVGGAEVAVKEITERLPRREVRDPVVAGKDYEFVMITAKLRPDLPDTEKVGNIEVHRLGKGNNWDKYRLIVLGASYASKLGHFNAIWGIMASYAGFAALRFKKRNLDVPFLLTLQEGDSRWDIYKHVWWCWPYFKQIFKRADKIQAISNYLAKWASDLGAKCPVEVVPNGVDIEKFSIFNFSRQSTGSRISSGQFSNNSQFSILDFKRQLGLCDGDKVVITASRLVKKNGVGDLIKAMEFLDDNVHLLIAGDGELKNKLVKLVDELKLVDRVRFLGNVSHDELPKYLWASDVFCRPSLSEGLGNGFLEAMAAGVPVVGTRVGGIPDFLIDSETGLFCKVGNPKNIADKIKKILTDNDLREKLILNGKKLVQEKYSWGLIADKMREML